MVHSNFISIQTLGRNGDSIRLWIESQRLEHLGFSHGIPLNIHASDARLILRPAVLAENHVSSRRVPAGRRPIIDLANQSILSGLSEYSEVKVIASYERIEVSPSHRAFAIQRSRTLRPPFRVMEVFAGGGTMTSAVVANTDFKVVSGVEINPDNADEWQGHHLDAALVQADIRSLHTSDLPDFDVLVGGIPCTSHSLLGRAKKRLAEKPELGDTGDLFLPVVTMISQRMPAAVVFENVPAFANSLAGDLLQIHLQRIGYHVFTTILQPNAEWGEIEDRKRWLLVATLQRPFRLNVPQRECRVPLSSFLDAPDPERDSTDANRIARTISGLRVHNLRHRELRHGFGFTIVDGKEMKLPTIPKSYHKINTGPFVKTPFGPRLLRLEEIERIHGSELRTRDYATAVQMLGQGVLTRVFQNVFFQLSEHLNER